MPVMPCFCKPRLFPSGRLGWVQQRVSAARARCHVAAKLFGGCFGRRPVGDSSVSVARLRARELSTSVEQPASIEPLARVEQQASVELLASVEQQASVEPLASVEREASHQRASSCKRASSPLRASSRERALSERQAAKSKSFAPQEPQCGGNCETLQVQAGRAAEQHRRRQASGKCSE